MNRLIEKKIDNCPDFKEALLETGDAILAECTYDTFWASGLNAEMTSCTRPSDFPGKNQLGIILMEKRSALQLAREFMNDVSLEEKGIVGTERNSNTQSTTEENKQGARRKILNSSTPRPRSSSAPRSIVAGNQDIKLFLNPKRNAEESPDKEGTLFKQKSGKC
jgi:hypothetical protein